MGTSLDSKSEQTKAAAPGVIAGTKVAILMGSDSDLPVMQKCLDALKDFGVPAAIHVMSAHRSPWPNTPRWPKSAASKC